MKDTMRWCFGLAAFSVLSCIGESDPYADLRLSQNIPAGDAAASADGLPPPGQTGFGGAGGGSDVAQVDGATLERKQPVYDAAPPTLFDGGANPSDGASSEGAAPSADAGVFGSPRCKGQNLLLCEDFESGQLDGSLWKTSGSGMSIDQVHAARGKYAAHAKVGSGGGVTNIYETKTFPVSSGSVFVRAFVYFQQYVSDPHTDFLQLQGNLGGDARWIGVSNMARYWDISYYAPNNGSIDYWRYDKPNIVPTDQWQCIEWEYAGSSKKLHVWKDEKELAPLAIDGISNGEDWGASQLDRLSLGIFAWHALQDGVPELNVWFDEIAVDKARIGCSR